MEEPLSLLKKAIKAKDGSKIIAILTMQEEESQDWSTKLKEFFEVINKQDCNNFWAALEGIISQGCVAIVNYFKEQNDLTVTLKNVQCAVKTAHTFLQSKAPHQSDSFLKLVINMSRLLSSIDRTDASINTLKNTLSLLCETMYQSGVNGSEDIVPDVISYLLLEGLKASSKDIAIKRIWAMRNGFKDIDFQEPESSQLKELLLRCFVHPSFLKSQDGLKFLSFAISLSDGLLLDSVVALMKTHVVNGSKSPAIAYGEVLQRAWKDQQTSHESTTANSNNKHPANDSASAHILSALEEVIQNILHDAVHAQDSKYFRGLRFLIQEFHDVRRTDQLDNMLNRVFEPIIWRSLRCANAIVRMQAAMLFLDVFPLQKASSNPEEADLILQKQFDQLTSLLKDGDHRVRAVATSGVCRIVKDYWEVLPPATIHNLLKYICDTLAYDASSPNVRLAAIKGIHELLSQPLSHTAVKTLFPLIAKSINDKSEKVRHSFINLLNEVKSLRDVHFYDLVPVDTLLARMVDDRHIPEVASALSELLLNSFYPQTGSNEHSNLAVEQLQRCLKFSDENLVAAEAFYSCLHYHVGIGSVTKLTSMLWRLLAEDIEKLQGKVNDENQSANNPNKPSKRQRETALHKEHIPTAQDVSIILARFYRVIRIIFAMLNSIETKLIGETPSLQLLFRFCSPALMSRCLTTLFCDFEVDNEALVTLLDTVAIVSRLMSSSSDHAKEVHELSAELNLSFISEKIVGRASTITNQPEIKRAMLASSMQLIWTLDTKADFIEALKQSFGVSSTKKAKGKAKSSKQQSLSVDQSAVLLLQMTEMLCKPAATSALDLEVSSGRPQRNKPIIFTH